MTRGKILFIKDNGEIYCTTEFNGDMYPSGNGGEVVERFEEGYFSDFTRYKRFVENFNRRNYGYEESLIKNLYQPDYIVDIRENYTDYLYIINETEKQWTIVDKNNNVAFLPKNSLAIVRFSEVEKIIHREPQPNKNNACRKLSKKEFCSILERLKEAKDLVDKVDELFNKSRENIENDFANGASLQISHESTVVKLLKIIMNDQNDWIDYFIYELDYGREYEAGMILDEDGKDIEISSGEKLYDYICGQGGATIGASIM